MGSLLAAVVPWVLLAVAGGGLALALANRGLAPAEVRGRWLKFGVYLLVISAELVLAAAGRLLWLALPVVVLGAAEFRAALAAWPPPGLPRWRRRGLQLLALGVAAGLVGFCLLLPPAVQLLVALEVLVFDGFCQVSGQLVGRHRLVPRLSPAKTWEGLAGLSRLPAAGLAAAAAAGAAVRAGPGPGPGRFHRCPGPRRRPGCLRHKRRCGLKDFSRRIPGLGGVLDRFDSLLAAATGWLVLAATGLVPLAAAPGS